MKLFLILFLSRCAVGRYYRSDNAIEDSEPPLETLLGNNETFPEGNDVAFFFDDNFVRGGDEDEDDDDERNNGAGLRNVTDGYETGQTEDKEPISILFEEPYQLPDDEEWPEEVAHLFAPREDSTGSDEAAARRRRWAEWTTDELEVREDSWDEPPLNGGTVRDPRDEPFVAYVVNDTYIMSRCSSGKMAKSLVIACPQPRGSKFHRIVYLSNVYYGWSQMDAKICQHVEGDCTLRYEYLHKQLMKPTIPQNEEEFKSLGPTYFCNSWDGNGREDWVMPTKRWCTIGLRRSSPSMDPLDFAANPWAKKYGYTWEGCGSGYDWFDYLQAEYTCIDVMEPIAEVPEPTKRPTCKAPIRPITTTPKPDNNAAKDIL